MTDVTHRLDGSTLLLEINRPDSANALRRQTIHKLEAQLQSAEASQADPTTPEGQCISAVVITGGLRRFSAGADLATLTGSRHDLEFDDTLQQLCQRIAHSPLPVVAAVEGACFGAALDLAWACDAVVVSEEARFALPSTRLGILYNPMSVARLHSRLGSSTLRRLMVLQQTLTGQELPLGSAIVTPTGKAASTAVRLVQAVTADREAMAVTKALLASLDTETPFDPALWQTQRQDLVASPARREALDSHRASLKRKTQA